MTFMSLCLAWQWKKGGTLEMATQSLNLTMLPTTHHEWSVEWLLFLPLPHMRLGSARLCGMAWYKKLKHKWSIIKSTTACTIHKLFDVLLCVAWCAINQNLLIVRRKQPIFKFSDHHCEEWGARESLGSCHKRQKPQARTPQAPIPS